MVVVCSQSSNVALEPMWTVSFYDKLLGEHRNLIKLPQYKKSVSMHLHHKRMSQTKIKETVGKSLGQVYKLRGELFRNITYRFVE